MEFLHGLHCSSDLEMLLIISVFWGDGWTMQLIINHMALDNLLPF
jgi:hypothetical protein